MSTLTANATVTISAPVAKVWEAIVTPELIKQYFFGTNVETTWEVGSPVVFRGSWEGKEYEDKGTVLEIEPEKLLKFDYWSSFSDKPDLPESYSTITYTLTEEDGQTTVKITQDDMDDEAAKNQSEQNWQLVLGQMKELLEK